jgi:hypothetical protein
MDTEQVWQELPARMQFAATRIADEYRLPGLVADGAFMSCGEYCWSFRAKNGLSSIVLRWTHERGLRYVVTVHCFNGAVAQATFSGRDGLTDYHAQVAPWGEHHVEAWRRACSAIGAASVPFPGRVP